MGFDRIRGGIHTLPVDDWPRQHREAFFGLSVDLKQQRLSIRPGAS